MPNGRRSELTDGELRVRALTRRDGARVEQLFGANGACGGCWCMWARVPRGGKLWEASKGDPNRRALLELVRSGAAHALLALDGERVVGWCSLGPRADYPRLERVKAARSDWDESTWSLVCFFIPASERGRGVASMLLDAAVAYSREHGARSLEGYPVRSAGGDGAKIPAAFAWTGVIGMFERRGFTRLSPRGARELWRIEFDGPRERASKTKRAPSAARGEGSRSSVERRA